MIVMNDENIVLSDDQKRLHILKSRITDAGHYKCVARNPAGDSAKAFQVEIIGERFFCFFCTILKYS